MSSEFDPREHRAQAKAAKAYAKAQRPWYKKKRVLLPLAFLLLLVVIGVSSGGGSNTPSSSTASSANDSQADDMVIYEVGGTATGAMVTYSTGGGGGQSQETVNLPWTKQVPEADGFGVYVLSAQNQGDSGTVICRITKDGEVVSENTSSGGYAVVSCSGS